MAGTEGELLLWRTDLSAMGTPQALFMQRSWFDREPKQVHSFPSKPLQLVF